MMCYFTTNGENVVICSISKAQPQLRLIWNSRSAEFYTIYGFMPAKEMIFSLKCDPVFDFGTGVLMQLIQFSWPYINASQIQKSEGQKQSWDILKCNPISKPLASDATYFAWCPDGEHTFIGLHAPSCVLIMGTCFSICQPYPGTVSGWTISSENNCFPSSLK